MFFPSFLATANRNRVEEMNIRCNLNFRGAAKVQSGRPIVILLFGFALDARKATKIERDGENKRS
jgi:hypothetical protein